MPDASAHTPGPWVVQDDEMSTDVEELNIRASYRSVAIVAPCPDDRASFPEQWVVVAEWRMLPDGRAPLADIGLIAAAPDLLDAGERALGWLREAYGHAFAPYDESAHRCINALAAAVAKAKGRAP